MRGMTGRGSSATRTIVGWTVLCVGSVLAGLLAQGVGLPAGWLVGPMLAAVAGLDGKTAALGTLPGAASGMLAMSGPLGADPRLVALMQYTRVVVVVFSAALVSRLGLVPGSAPHEISAQGLQATSGGTALAQDACLVYA